MTQASREAEGWTRRGMLAALVAAAGLPVLPAAYGSARPSIPEALAGICIAATTAPRAARLGAAAAEGCSASELAGSLHERLKAERVADWRSAIVASGRRDIAAGDLVEVLGQSLMRTEAEVLALGVLLRSEAALT